MGSRDSAHFICVIALTLLAACPDKGNDTLGQCLEEAQEWRRQEKESRDLATQCIQTLETLRDQGRIRGMEPKP